MSKTSNNKNHDISKIIAVVVWPSIIVIALLSTVFRNLIENFSIVSLIVIVFVFLLIILPLLGAFGLFNSKSDDK